MGQQAVPPADLFLNFADGEYRFHLGLQQIAELQEKCNAGVGEIFARLMRGRVMDGTEIALMATQAVFRAEDVRETVRLGLIGGGRGVVAEQEVKVDAVKARVLCERYLDPLPLLDQWKFAAAIMAARMVGYDDGRAKAVGAAPAQKKSKEAVPVGSA
jgi:hypothetical protein